MARGRSCGGSTVVSAVPITVTIWVPVRRVHRGQIALRVCPELTPGGGFACRRRDAGCAFGRIWSARDEDEIAGQQQGQKAGFNQELPTPGGGDWTQGRRRGGIDGSFSGQQSNQPGGDDLSDHASRPSVMTPGVKSVAASPPPWACAPDLPLPARDLRRAGPTRTPRSAEGRRSHRQSLRTRRGRTQGREEG